MSCPECGEGTATRQKTLFRYRIGNAIVVIPEAEHLICDKCGYEFMPEDVGVYGNTFSKGAEVHLSGKITTEKDKLSLDVANIEKHIKLRGGDELYIGDDEIVIVSKEDVEK